MLQALRCVVVLGGIVLAASTASAQAVDLGGDGADIYFHGASADARAGTYLDHGTMNNDSRRDLIIGAPGQRGGLEPGRVYVLFGGIVPPPGERSLSTMSVTITGAATGDGFGFSVAAGNVLNTEGTNPRNLIVGAPYASSDRGRVYVFRAGMTVGTSIDASAALVTIVGAPNDHLGSAIATADLDGDGYRDIVIGAPGNGTTAGKVYVIYGGPTLSGQTRDMSSATTGADVTMTGVGIGNVITAGPVSGPEVYSATYADIDQRNKPVYDVFIGAPSLNLVYMIHGPGSRTLSRSMTLAGSETAYFVGVGSDSAGTSLRVGDFDADGRHDLLIGAPRGGTAQAGAVYLLWGKNPADPADSALRSGSLADANVTLLGPSAGARLGEAVTAGDINRDVENDVVMIAPGASSAGDVLVYYGRNRGSFGVARPNGTRMVDLSLTGEANLRFIGDATAGGIASVFAYELTGEGARDIIVGAPNATTAGGTASGRVYVAVSPKLRLITSPAYASVVQGGSGRGALSVVNRSATRITYRAQSITPWITASPAEGSSALSTPASLNLMVDATGLAPGDHVGFADVISTSEHLELTAGQLRAQLNLTVITQPTVAANVAFPAMAGATITWTAQATGGAAGLLYQFWRLDPGVGWRMVRDYGPSNTYSWQPTPADAGDHNLQVWVKTPQSSNTYDAFVATPAFAIQRSVPRITSFTNDGIFPIAPNTPVRLTTTAMGGSAALEYKFWVLREGSGWTTIQDYSSSDTATWTPTVTGRYVIQTWVRSVGVPDAYEAWRATDWLSVSATSPLTVQPIQVTPALPAKVGMPVTFTSAASGGSNGPLQYQFWRLDRGSWSIVQAYSASRTYTWTPSGADVGDHAIQVWVRSGGSSAAQEAWQTTGIFSVVRVPLASPSLAADHAFPVPTLTPVRWTATATGGVGPLQYKFWVFRNGEGWTMARDYSTSNSFTWTPPAGSEGSYAMQVWIRSADSTANYDAWTGTGFFTIGPSGPARVASFGADKVLPAGVGTTVTWTAAGGGGTAGPLQYRFWRYSATTGTWTIVQDYSSDNRFSWTIGSGDTGTFALQVWVRSAGSSSNFEGWAATPYFSVQ